jgi:hypothetical protein
MKVSPQPFYTHAIRRDPARLMLYEYRINHFILGNFLNVSQGASSASLFFPNLGVSSSADTNSAPKKCFTGQFNC